MASELAADVVERLRQGNHKLVLAESCTCGRVAAELGLVAGVSQFLCGSFVVYRANSKLAWLEIDPQIIQQHSTESMACTKAIAESALKKTPEATVGIAITGDLGPGVDPKRDGQIYIAGRIRQAGKLDDWIEYSPQLQTADRESRQREATQLVLNTLQQLIQRANNPEEPKSRDSLPI